MKSMAIPGCRARSRSARAAPLISGITTSVTSTSIRRSKPDMRLTLDGPVDGGEQIIGGERLDEERHGQHVRIVLVSADFRSARHEQRPWRAGPTPGEDTTVELGSIHLRHVGVEDQQIARLVLEPPEGF